MENNTFFCEEGMNNTYQKFSRNKLLDYIRANAPITKYKLSKDLGIAYTTINYAIKAFEFAGLVKIRVELADNNKTHALICMPEEEIKKDEENEK